MSRFSGCARVGAGALIWLIAMVLVTEAVAASGASRLNQGFFIGIEGLQADYDMPNIDKSVGYGASAGFKFNHYVALELLYQDFGKGNNDKPRSPDAGRWEMDGASTALLLRLGIPFGRWSELFVEGGYHAWHLTLSEFDVGRIAHQRDKDWQFGGGALSYLSRSWIVGARYRVLEVSQGSMANAAIFAQWVF